MSDTPDRKGFDPEIKRLQEEQEIALLEGDEVSLALTGLALDQVVTDDKARPFGDPTQLTPQERYVEDWHRFGDEVTEG
jgi:hypothetical protein